MKTVAIGMNMKTGPYGGGNQFGHALTEALQKRNITVVHSLGQPDIDAILVTEIRPWLDICAFSMHDAARHRARFGTPVVLRVNECDERKGKKIKSLNAALRAAARLADHTVYISSWLQRTVSGSDTGPVGSSSVIRNGADEKIFNSARSLAWDGTSPLKIVTHHWSSHLLKGWDAYQLLDSLAGGPLRGKIEFTYIGNVPAALPLPHTNVIPPLSGEELAHALQQHHVYVTASINEPAGMHHIEGALCGLPLLYRESGALPEYCQGFGIPFKHVSNVPLAIEDMMRRYQNYKTTVAAYPHTAARMTEQYTQLLAALTRPSRTASRRHWINEKNLTAALGAVRLADALAQAVHPAP